MRTDSASANLSDRLVASVGQAVSARTTPWLYRALLRLLSHGEPVTIVELAAAAGQASDDVQRDVAGWNDTEYDRQGRIIGWGLTLRPTPHRFNVDGKHLYTWCAPDTLFFPAVIGRPAHIESPCVATGTPIRLTVDPTAGGISTPPGWCPRPPAPGSPPWESPAREPTPRPRRERAARRRLTFPRKSGHRVTRILPLPVRG